MTSLAIDDPFVRRLFRLRTGLRPGGPSGEREVLATYETREGAMPFAICRDGLLLDPYADARFIPFVEVEDAGYYNRENILRAKSARTSPSEIPEPLSIRLRDGEIIDLAVDVRTDGMPDHLTIAKIIHERAALYRFEERKASPD
jgi:hypothetical protein